MGEAMRKILVIGSAGFLMSNMMRYMLYRTKDFEFASVDRLDSAEDHRRKVYLHRKHTFYIGDAGDRQFLDKLMMVENPDIVVVGTGTRSKTNTAAAESIVMPTAALCDSIGRVGRRRIIQVVPDADAIDFWERAAWNLVDSMILRAGGMILRLPLCFGRRGHGPFEQALQTVLSGNIPEGWQPDDKKRWFAYAEDVASMLWFIMEHPQSGNIVRMPAIGYASAADMLGMCVGSHGWRAQVSEGTMGMEHTTVKGWLPDSASMEEAVVKTAEWYSMNKWFFNTSEKRKPLVSASPPPGGHF
jgi:nucleoside-diphosphate-sugar epimerase